MSHAQHGQGMATPLPVLEDAPASVHALDPAARVIALVLFAVTTVSVQSFAALALALAAALTALLLMRDNRTRTLKRMAAMDGFIIVMLAMLPFTVSGTPLFSVWGFGASLEGLERALQIALRANAIVLLALVLLGSMEPVTLGHALFRLRVPAPLVHLLFFTVRYIDVLHQEYRRVRTAMRARAFVASNSRHTYVTIGYVVGMMLVRAMERSERIVVAMKCRAFSGRFPVLVEQRWRLRDAVFLSGSVLLLLAMVGMEL